MSRACRTACLLALVGFLGCPDQETTRGTDTLCPLRILSVDPPEGVKGGIVPVRLYFQCAGHPGAVQAWIGGRQVLLNPAQGPSLTYLWTAEGIVLPIDTCGPAAVRLVSGEHGTAEAPDGFFVYPTAQHLTVEQAVAPRPAPRVAAAPDLDGDGRPDPVLLHRGVYADRVSLLSGPTSLQPAAELACPGPVSSLEAADFDGDGRIDLALFMPLASQVLVLRNLGAFAFAPRCSLPLPPDARLAVAGDFDGIRGPDLCLIGPVWARPWLNDGTGSLVAGTTASLGPDPCAAAAADLDRDGFADLVVGDGAESSLSCLRGSAPGILGPRQTSTLAAPLTSLALGDLDPDGKPDGLLGTPGALETRLQAPDGTLVPWAVTSAAHPLSLALVDVNRDGALDGAVVDGNALSVRFTDGGGGFRPSLSLDRVFSSPLDGLAAADVDGDGFPDLITAEPQTGLVYVCYPKPD